MLQNSTRNIYCGLYASTHFDQSKNVLVGVHMCLHYPVQIYKKYAYTSTCTFEQIADVKSYVEIVHLCSMTYMYSGTPHERPHAFYDRFFTDDGLSTLYKRPLINDHLVNATRDHSNFTFTPDEQPSDRWPAYFLT